MRRRLSRVAVHGNASARRRRAWRVRWALGTSLAAHLVLAWVFTLSTKIRHLVARADLSAAQRRELVFAIWDECAEESDATTDYGAMARATVLTIVREAFPVGSDRAYQPTELLALNERRSSRQRFVPYDPSPLTGVRHPDGGASTECP
jgi:hypothetical protein